MRISEQVSGGVVVLEKRLVPRARRDAEAVARFRAEAAVLELLGGRVTPRLVEQGEDESGPFLRMAKIAFPTVAERLEAATGAPVAARWIERAFAAAVAAVAELHVRGVVHADLSPTNVAVDDGATSAVLLDLELAVWEGAPPRDGAFRGTVAYVAPEVARGEPPTPRSDLFALAATFLHAATAEPPRVGGSLASAIAAAAEVPLDLARYDGLSTRGPAHAAICACLAHDPSERPASAREVLDRLTPSG